MGDGGSGAQHILLSQRLPPGGARWRSFSQAGLACRPACSRSQLRSAGILLAQPDVPAIKQPG
jgi:hypothetical protein